MTRELADELGGEGELAVLANAALARVGQPSGVVLLLAESGLNRRGRCFLVVDHGDVTWVDFRFPRGSDPVHLHPVVVLQANWLLTTAIRTVIVVPLTSNLEQQTYPAKPSSPRARRAWTRTPSASSVSLAPCAKCGLRGASGYQLWPRRRAPVAGLRR